jgi:hypothetical protein
MLILYYIYDVICFISCLSITILFYSHDVPEFDCPIQFRYLILNNLLICVIQMYNVIDVFYISRRYHKM